MAFNEKQVDALVAYILGVIQQQIGGMNASHIVGTWTATEAVDVTLSKVTLAGGAEVARFVPKLAHVTGLSPGDSVMMVRDKGVPLTIIGRLAGDIRLASI